MPFVQATVGVAPCAAAWLKYGCRSRP